jgi:hypothetical protein
MRLNADTGQSGMQAVPSPGASITTNAIITPSETTLAAGESSAEWTLASHAKCYYNLTATNEARYYIAEASKFQGQSQD